MINGSFCGILSGILGGLAPGTPIIYYFSSLDESREYSATTQLL